MYKNKSILITGGAGYIGSHLAKQLLCTTDYNITILDNLSTGSRDTLDRLLLFREFSFIEMDLNDFEKLGELLRQNSFDCIIHFAGSIVVPESVKDPLKYYMNNTVNTINLVKCAVESKVKKFIFSSTAAVYGETDQLPEVGVSESFPLNPINPYGMSKLMSERVLEDTAAAYNDFRYVIFRYFNVAGADINYTNGSLEPRIGHRFPNATHLIKIASECAAGKREKMSIFGKDFNTPDGTGVRDYIHVDDLADAHLKAISYLDDNPSDIFNAGYGRGYSVREVIGAMKACSDSDFPVETAPRREGDTPAIIADNRKIKSKMGWIPKFDDISLICQSAYQWEKTND
ncbi:MAG: UDP-glucose 4-epimerase GalE [Denitrovibrio sp.]|nr:MAG: UDP-glucose 4-epimerase GalE [Denitrovibrio sp.]